MLGWMSQVADGFTHVSNIIRVGYEFEAGAAAIS
jgi:hypothetical protein